MTDRTLRERAHDLDVTVWVGKSGIDPVVDELDDQLGDSQFVQSLDAVHWDGHGPAFSPAALRRSRPWLPAGPRDDSCAE